MSRSLFALLALALMATSQGCRICDSPYDYCGPVMPCNEGCGHGGCGHSHYDGGYVDAGHSGHGGCATCGNGGGHAMEYSNEYEGGSVIQGQPTPAPTPMPAPPMNQGRRPAPKQMSKASYEAPMNSARPQSSLMPAKPAKMSPYPTMQGNGPRMASGNSMKSDSGRGLIFW